MREADVFVMADRALNGVVRQITDDQWAMTMPASFVMRHTGQTPTLREVINYHAYDDAWVPDMLAGRTMDEVGRDKFDGDLLGADPRTSFASIVDTACAAATHHDDADRTVHCSFGDFSAREYFWQINSFRGLRAHDLALVIGVEAQLPHELVQGMWDEISPHAEEWRSYGVFPPAVPVPADASLLDRLLGLTGRQPASV
ncbi:MAG TPA: TIGR03086 family protein [Pseudonocardiaceae bacterium]